MGLFALLASFTGSSDNHDRGGASHRPLRVTSATTPDTLPAEDPDRETLNQLRAGNEQALAQLFHKYSPAIHRFTMRYLRSADRADDVVQDLFVRLWDQRSQLTLRSTLRAYLFSAAYHLTLNVLAHDRVVSRHVDNTLAAGDDLPNTRAEQPDDALLTSELAQAAQQRIANMPERMRAVYQLSRDAGLSYAEIAATLGVSVNTVYVQMGRALHALEKALADWLPSQPPKPPV